MKKFLVITGLSLITITSFAQRPGEGSWGLGFNITGLATVAINNYGGTALSGQTIYDPAAVLNSGFPFTLDAILPQNVLQIQDYLSDDMALRITLGINSLSQKTTTGDSTFFTGLDNEFTTSSTKVSAFSFGLGGGLEKHMGSSAKADPYVGAEIMLSMLGKIKDNSQTTTTADDYSDDNTVDVSYAGGFAAGLNLIGGFNYFFSDNISIGGEVGLGFGFASTGGDWTQTGTETLTAGGSTSTSNLDAGGTYKVSNSGFRVNSYAGINLTVFWGE